jgi:hypothetical protein
MTSRDFVSTRRLRIVNDGGGALAPTAMSAPLGVLSIHLDGEVCRVGCEFCYLGNRVGNRDGESGHLDPPQALAMMERALERLDYHELAVAVSEPIGDHTRAALAALRRAAGKKRLSLTTTLKLALTPGLLGGVDRVNLSVDPRKGRVALRSIVRAAQRVRHAGAEVVLIVSLTTPEFATRLVDGGLLEALVDLPDVDKVALNALKPPPAWCGRDFWMKTLARLGPLLQRALDRKLFLDCWVAARLLGLGGCPARADLTPAAHGLAFRGCVYQPAPDFITADADELAARLADFTPPERCPFPIP